MLASENHLDWFISEFFTSYFHKLTLFQSTAPSWFLWVLRSLMTVCINQSKQTVFIIMATRLMWYLSYHRVQLLVVAMMKNRETMNSSPACLPFSLSSLLSHKMKASGLVLFFFCFFFNLHTDQVNGVFQSPFPARLLVTFFFFNFSWNSVCLCLYNQWSIYFCQ